MGDIPSFAISRLLRAIRGGVAGAVEQLCTLLLRQLRRLSTDRKASGTRTADLIQDAYMDVVRDEDREAAAAWQVFAALAMRSLRQIIVEDAREKRETEQEAAEVIELDMALERLFALDEPSARVVETHFFGGGAPRRR